MNIQSLSSKYDELNYMLEVLEYPSIIALSEIWKPYDSLLEFKNYHPSIHKMRKSIRGGGVSIHVRDNLKVIKKYDFDELNFKCIEAVGVTIEFQGRHLTFVSLYKSPIRPNETALRELKMLFDFFFDYNSQVLYFGDTNMNILNKPKHIRKYMEILDTYVLRQLVQVPTRVTHETSTLIDHVLSNDKIDSKVFVLEDNISDHQPVLCSCIPKKNRDENVTSITPQYLNYKKTVKAIDNLNWEEIEIKIKEMPASHATSLITNTLQKCLSYESRLKRKSVPLKPFMTDDILKLRAKKLRLRKKLMKSPTEMRKRAFDSINKKYKSELKLSKKTYYHKEIERAEGNGKKIWSIINEVLNRKTEKKQSTIVLKEEGNIVRSNEKIADMFNSFYKNLGNEIAKTLAKPDVTVDQLLESTDTPLEQFSFKPMEPKEIEEIIDSLKPKTSSSYDKIPNKLLKATKVNILSSITHIINSSFDEGQFPEPLKIAKLIPLYKADDEYDPSNYRPISNLSSISKVIEKAAQVQISKFTNRNNIIPNLQFGFRKGHSTIHPLIVAKNHIENELNKNKHVFVAAIDLKKAFDLVPTGTILPKKLKKLNFDIKSINWITSFFSNRQQYVNVNNTNSSITNLHDISVVQGSSMGPPTFSLFIYDLPKHTKFSCYLFADDTTLIASHDNIDELIDFANKELKNVQNYMAANLLSLNLKKTVYSLYHPKKAKIKSSPKIVKIGDHEIEQVESFKFLGVNIDNHLTFYQQYTQVKTKMKKGIAALYHVRNVLPIKTKLIIFNSLVKPAYEYGSPIWSLALYPTQVDEITRLQKRAIRLAFGARKTAHTEQLFKKAKIIRFDMLFLKYAIETVFKKLTNKLPEKVSELLDHFDHPRNTRNSRKKQFKIPTNLEPGNIMYELMKHWNDTDEYLKTAIFEESIKVKPSFNKIKKITREYIQKQLPICTENNCYSCAMTRTVMKRIEKLEMLEKFRKLKISS